MHMQFVVSDGIPIWLFTPKVAVGIQSLAGISVLKVVQPIFNATLI